MCIKYSLKDYNTAKGQVIREIARWKAASIILGFLKLSVYLEASPISTYLPIVQQSILSMGDCFRLYTLPNDQKCIL